MSQLGVILNRRFLLAGRTDPKTSPNQRRVIDPRDAIHASARALALVDALSLDNRRISGVVIGDRPVLDLRSSVFSYSFK